MTSIFFLFDVKNICSHQPPQQHRPGQQGPPQPARVAGHLHGGVRGQARGQEDGDGDAAAEQLPHEARQQGRDRAQPLRPLPPAQLQVRVLRKIIHETTKKYSCPGRRRVPSTGITAARGAWRGTTGRTRAGRWSRWAGIGGAGHVTPVLTSDWSRATCAPRASCRATPPRCTPRRSSHSGARAWTPSAGSRSRTGSTTTSSGAEIKAQAE